MPLLLRRQKRARTLSVPNRELTMNNSILAVAAAATMAVTLAGGGALAQDAEAGKTEFKKCMPAMRV